LRDHIDATTPTMPTRTSAVSSITSSADADRLTPNLGPFARFSAPKIPVAVGAAKLFGFDNRLRSASFARYSRER